MLRLFTRRIGAAVAVTAALLVTATSAQAAFITVGINDDTPYDPTIIGTLPAVQAGDEVSIFLQLAPGEVASVLEAAFGTEGGISSFAPPSNVDWDFGCFGNTVGGASLVSCTSNNAPGQRLAGVFTVEDPLGFVVTLASADVLRDIDEPPFADSVNLRTPIGTVLAVGVPEGGTLFLMASGLLGLGLASRRRV